LFLQAKSASQSNRKLHHSINTLCEQHCFVFRVRHRFLFGFATLQAIRRCFLISAFGHTASSFGKFNRRLESSLWSVPFAHPNSGTLPLTSRLSPSCTYFNLIFLSFGTVWVQLCLPATAPRGIRREHRTYQSWTLPHTFAGLTQTNQDLHSQSISFANQTLLPGTSGTERVHQSVRTSRNEPFSLSQWE
jgi:hypothetical protein